MDRILGTSTMNKILIKIAIFTLLFLAVNIKTAIAEPHTFSCDDYYYLKDFAECEVIKHWDDSQWKSFDTIISKESSWIHTGPHNPKLSSAYGLGGFLNGTWKETQYTKTDDPRIQVKATIEYIDGRYGTPDKALQTHIKKNWY